VFQALTRLFTRRDRLTVLSRQSDRSAFARCLLESEVAVLAALRSEGLDAASFTREELFAQIETAARDERECYEPFVYAEGNSLRLPFFSTSRHAETFCGEYSREHNRVFPFEVLTLRGTVLVSLIPACDLLVLNARTPDEYPLSYADLDLLRAA
jgi:hypothetical protein